MKNLFLTTVALLFAAPIFAQDVLTLRSGKKYQVKLLEITNTDLRFKMHNNPEGPVYTISRNSFESIVYENGATEEFAVHEEQSPQTVTINGYNFSASASTTISDQTQTPGGVHDNSTPSQPATVSQKKATFGEVMGAILATGLIALDVAAKIENSKCTQRHQHTHNNCRK